VTEGRSGIFFVRSHQIVITTIEDLELFFFFFFEKSFHVCVYMNELCFAEKRGRYADINNRDGRPFRCGRTS